MAGITARRCSTAQRALSAGAERAPTQLLLARAHAGLGEADQAVAAAGGGAHCAAPKEQSFAAADVLMLLGREREARMALESAARYRRRCAPQAAAPPRAAGLQSRRLRRGAAAMFSALLKDHGFLGDRGVLPGGDRRAARRVGTALRGYQMLGGTGAGSAPRARAPPPCSISRASATEALELLQAKRRCAAGGAARGARSRRRSCCPTAARPIRRWRASTMRWRAFPGHPDLLYQKAILLEKAGRTDAAIAQLESSVSRSARRTARSAMRSGFILADHNRDLSRAERLINSALKIRARQPGHSRQPRLARVPARHAAGGAAAAGARVPPGSGRRHRRPLG